MHKIDRRQFIRQTAAASVAASALSKTRFAWGEETPNLAVAQNASPAELVRQVMDMLGGMSRFVKEGQKVFLKPNIGWDRLPEQAADTNPEAVAEVVRMCKEAGADKVRIVDRTCNQARRCYKRSGIEDAAKEAGAEVRHIIESRFKETEIPNGKLINSWPIYKDALEFDVFINMPIAKVHSISRLTLGMKNMLGVLGGNRGGLHKDFHQKIVDINSVLKPDLTIIDAYRIMVANGPSGGNLEDVETPKVMIAGTDPVAVDTYAVGLFGIDPQEMAYLVNAHERGMGEIDLSRVNILKHDFSA